MSLFEDLFGKSLPSYGSEAYYANIKKEKEYVVLKDCLYFAIRSGLKGGEAMKAAEEYYKFLSDHGVIK